MKGKPQQLLYQIISAEMKSAHEKWLLQVKCLVQSYTWSIYVQMTLIKSWFPTLMHQYKNKLIPSKVRNNSILAPNAATY